MFMSAMVRIFLRAERWNVILILCFILTPNDVFANECKQNVWEQSTINISSD